MRVGLLTIGWMLTGCNGSSGLGPTDTLPTGVDPSTDPFNPSNIAVVPGWMDSEISGNEEACRTNGAVAQYWDDASIATTWFAGDYTLLGDTLVGNEFWILHPNPTLAATGFQACTVVWDVSGSIDEPINGGAFSVTLSAFVDEAQSDCIQDPSGQPVWVGDDTFTATYDVIDSGGNATVNFPSGTNLGRGEVTNDRLTWLSDYDCKVF